MAKPLPLLLLQIGSVSHKLFCHVESRRRGKTSLTVPWI